MRIGTVCLSALLMMLILASSFLQRDFITSSAAPGANALGFEPWYYYVGGLVNSANGNLFFTATDISIKARGFTIEIVRAYNSLGNGTRTGFGYGWTFNYNVYLVDGGSIVSLVEGDGSVHDFVSIGDGNYSSPAGIHSRLTKNPDGSFIICSKDGSKYVFDSTGNLETILDKNENHLIFNYTDGKLTRVADDSGLELTVNYDASDRITSVVDPLARQIDYEYDESDNLIGVNDTIKNRTLYSYRSNHEIEAIVNPLGRVLTFSYMGGYSGDRVKAIGNSQYNFTSRTYYPPFPAYEIMYNIPMQGFVLIYKRHQLGMGILLNTVGNPEQITDYLNNVTTMSWDADMNMISYTDANNHTYQYGYDSFGNLLNETNPLGKSTTYTWNNVNVTDRYIALLTNITNALDYTTSYEYDEKGNLLRTIDANGSSSYQYCDSYGNVIREIDARGFDANYSYNSHGLMVNSTDASGNVTKYCYDEAGRLTAVVDAENFVTSYEYDDLDRLVRVVDATGNWTDYWYDAVGNLLGMTEANRNNSTTTVHEYIDDAREVVDSDGNKTTYEYDQFGNLARVVDSRGYVVSSTSYDALDRVVAVTDALGSTVSYSYDAVGNVLSKREKNGGLTLYAYDDLNRLINVTDALNYSTTYQYDALSRLVGITDARGCNTTFVYDCLDRLTQVIDAVENVKIYDYDAVGNLISEIDEAGRKTDYQYDCLNRLENVTDATGNRTSYGYDAVGNLVRITDPRNNSVSYGYDALHRLVNTTDALENIEYCFYDALGNLIQFTDALNHSTINQYDVLNRLTKVTDPLGNITQYFYDAVGNLLSLVDANGISTDYCYDPLNRMIRMTDALGGNSSYAYDPMGNVLNVTDQNGHVTRREYDILGRLTNITTPMGHETTYAYDGVGNMVRRVSANGNITDYSYDPLNRLTLVSYVGSGNVTLQYSPTSRTLEASNIAIGLSDTASYSYDVLDRVVSVSVNYSAFVKTINYTYDEVGNRKTMTDPDGGVTTYEYDKVNRLTRIEDPFGNETTYFYDGVGRRTMMTYPNQAVTTFVYDDADNLLNMETKNSGGITIARYTYSYDNVSNRLSMSEYGKGNTTYEYDALCRLAIVVYPSGEVDQYTYDGAGNRLSQVTNLTSTMVYAYDSDDRLLSTNGTTYTYDDNGNLFTMSNSTKVISYRYDFENRLIGCVTLPGLELTSFMYSTHGDRLSKTSEMVTTYYLYDFEDVLMELNGTGNLKTRFTHGPGIDEPISMLRGNCSYYLFDGLGSVIGLMDSDEQVTATYEYDVFGKTTSTNGTIENSYRFTSREYDNETALYFFRTRYYDASTGRFLRRDPLSVVGRFNAYVYAENGPVTFKDPYGMCTDRQFRLEWLDKHIKEHYDNIEDKKNQIKEDEARLEENRKKRFALNRELGELQMAWAILDAALVNNRKAIALSDALFNLGSVCLPGGGKIELIWDFLGRNLIKRGVIGEIQEWVQGGALRDREAIKQELKRVGEKILEKEFEMRENVAWMKEVEKQKRIKENEIKQHEREIKEHEKEKAEIEAEIRKQKPQNPLEKKEGAPTPDPPRTPQLRPPAEESEVDPLIRRAYGSSARKMILVPLKQEHFSWYLLPGSPELKSDTMPYYPPKRDIAIIDLNVTATMVNATVKNKGEAPETFWVNASYTLIKVIDPPIGNQTITLLAGANATLTFPWTPPCRGLYEIRIEAPWLLDEFNTTDNTQTMLTEIIPPSGHSNDESLKGYQIIALCSAVFSASIIMFRKKEKRPRHEIMATALKSALTARAESISEDWTRRYPM